MPATWPPGVPYRLLEEGAERINPEKGLRSQTDSGLGRQRQQFTAVQNGFAGNIKMLASALADFEAWYDELAGGTFNYPKHPFTGAVAEARFIVGRVGPARFDRQKARWMMPVAIEFL